MADGIRGPVCSSRLGPNWIDQGTLCRTKSSARGPLGFVMSLVMGAAPASQEAEGLQRDAKAMLDYDIAAIADSPFGKTPVGANIVELLRTVHKRGGVVYGETLNEGRGETDGHTITVNESFRGKFFPTVLELVHEGAHLLWRRNHPKGTNAKEKREDFIADELQSREKQLLFYEYLKAKKGCPDDSALEKRLTRRNNGTLRQAIEQEYDSSNPPKQGSP